MSSVTLVKKSAAKSASRGAAVGSAFVLVDNQDDTATIQGVDAGGNPVDISTVATLTATSSAPSQFSVDPPVGMTVTLHGLTPTPAGTPATLTVVATWNDGSVGPFTVTAPITITGSAATGLSIAFGTPTIRP